MIQTIEKNIDENIYTITQIPARRALKILTRLVKLLGPALAELVLANQKENENADSCIPKAVALLASSLDENDFENLVMSLLEGIRKDGMELKPAIFDMEFAGKFNTLLKLLKEILQFNYGDFFLGDGIINDLVNLK